MCAVRVCLLSTVHKTVDVRILEREASSLSSEGYSVTVFARQNQEVCAKDGIVLRSVPHCRSRLTRILSQAILLASVVRHPYDLYIVHDPELLPFAVMLRWFTGSPVVYDVHEDYKATIMTKEWIPGFARPAIARVFSLVERGLVRRLSAVIVAATFLADRYESLGVPTVILRNFPLSNWLSRPPKPVGQNPDGMWTLVYTGGLTRIRGMNTILETLRLAKLEQLPVRCIVVGVDMDQVRKSDHWSDISSLLSSGRLSLYPEVPHSQVLDIVADADIGWVPEDTYQNALLVKVLEYMTLGRPVITTDFPETSEIVRVAGSGIIVEGNEPRFHVAAIREMISDNARAARMGHAGRTVILRSLNWEIESAKLKELVRSLITSRDVCSKRREGTHA